MTDRGCERSCRLVTLRCDESDFQPSSRAAAVAAPAPPAVPRIGETFQSGLHGSSIPCIIREEEPSGLFIAGHRILRNTLVRLDKDVLLLLEHHGNTEILTSTL